MNDFVSNIPLIGDLTTLVKVLLIFNALLIGGVILLGFRAIQYKKQVDELSEEINRSVNDALESEAAPTTQNRKPRRRP